MEIEIFKQFKSDLIINEKPNSICLDQFQLYIGTSNGNLIIYSISISIKSTPSPPEPTPELESESQSAPESELEIESTESKSNQTKTPIEFKFIQTIDNFSSNSITTSNKIKISNSTNPSIDSINLIKEINSIVSLISGDIFLHDIKTFKLLSNTHQWTKSQASLISLKTSILRQNHRGLLLDYQIQSNLSEGEEAEAEEEQQPISADHPITSDLNSGLPIILSLLAVPCKRRLILFAWKDAQWINPKEIQIPHQARSVVFSTPLQIFIGYSTGEYATIKLQISSNDTTTQIHHQISDPFQLPIQTHQSDLTTPINLSSTSNSGPSNSNPSSGLVSGLFKTAGLASLGIAGSNKFLKNSVISIGSPTHEVIGVRDQLMTFMKPDGKLGRISPNPSTIHYSNSPIETIVQGPYLISLFSNPINSTSSLIIHSIPTLNHLQTLTISSLDQQKNSQVIKNSPSKKPSTHNEETSICKLLTVSSNHHNGPIVCVSPKLDEFNNQLDYHLEVFLMNSWSKQIHQFIESGEYLELLRLIQTLDINLLPDREILLNRLNGLCALLNFMDHQFDQSIDEFIKLNINPAKVISLYEPRISGKLNKSIEVWESLFGGRSVESYLKVKMSLNHLIELESDTLKIKPSSLIKPSKPIYQKVKTHDDDRDSIKSFKSQGLNSLKSKPSDLSIQKPKIEFKDESHFKQSIDVLIRYLTDRRQHVNKAFSKQNIESHSSSNESESSLDSLKAIKLRSPEELFQLNDIPIDEISNIDDLVQIAKMIDTTLFKCYLAIKPTMLGPLCRLPNWCEVDEVESLLMDAKRYHELLDLYHGKKQHDRALKLLKTMGESEEDLEERIDPIIRYLQKLGPPHLQLIFNTSKWIFSIIQTNQPLNLTLDNSLIRKSIEIFTADLSTVESLPKQEIINFLEIQNPLSCRIYLEYLIYELNENLIEIHEKLIHFYINEFRKSKGLGDEENSQKIYQSLLNHLIKSENYSANWVLGRLPLDEMFEARALTLGKIGQHDTALGIYINRLGNIKMAEEYCKRIYLENPESIGEKIYLILLKIYLRPPTTIQIQTQSLEQSTPLPPSLTPTPTGTEYPILNNETRLKASLKLLKEEGQSIKSIEEVLNLLPNWIDLNSLNSFFKKSLNQLNQSKRQIQIEKECLSNLDQNLKLIKLGVEQRRIKIDDKRLCMKCGKRIGNSVIAVHSPFGEVTHYQCRWEGEESRNGSRNER
ncbi:hypothetical protein DFH28DRAFT_1216235 [Melampsora americana]|nr:hypothetical protein DFH28DRAFT_1216235 [Melampsora americana]